MFLVQGVYITLAFVCLYRYGSKINESVLANIGDVNSKNEHLWENLIMQVLFNIILACHIPYIFFSGKESLLIIVDECWRRSISYTLSEKMQQFKRSQVGVSDSTMGNQSPYTKKAAPFVNDSRADRSGSGTMSDIIMIHDGRPLPK